MSCHRSSHASTAFA
ncbi:hypothetical protein ACFFHN_04925 [Kushneria avicenniae]